MIQKSLQSIIKYITIQIQESKLKQMDFLDLTSKKIVQRTIIKNSLLYQDATIREYLNMRRVTKDKPCLFIFLFYTFGLIIMLGIGLFYGNYNTVGLFTNDAVTDTTLRVTCQGTTPYVNEDYTSCLATCSTSNFYLSNVCLTSSLSTYNPTFTEQVSSLISIYNLKYTFPMIVYTTAGLLGVTALLFMLLVYASRLLYLYIVAVFGMLLGFSFYLLKLVELRVTQFSIGIESVFYTQDQNMRVLAFVLLGIYLVTFPFILFSPKKIKISVIILSKLKDYFKAMFRINLFTLFIIITAWGSLVIQVFLIINFYSAGTISSSPQVSMFYTYADIYLSNPASLAFHFIGVYWFYGTLISWHKYYTSSGICLWYFQESEGVYPLRRALKRSLNHLGSAAIDAILMPIQWIFLIAYSICKIDGQEQSQKQQRCITRCLLSMREMICRGYSNINRNSASSAVLTNLNFFESCTMSYEIFSQNSHKFFNIGGTLTVFITLFVCVLWVMIAFFIMYYEVYGKVFPPPISSMNLPIFTVLLIGLVIGSLFANIFTASIDCLIFCYLLELQSLMQNGREQQMLNRQAFDLKIKITLDECFYRAFDDKQKGKVQIYQETDENTLELNYVSRRE